MKQRLKNRALGLSSDVGFSARSSQRQVNKAVPKETYIQCAEARVFSLHVPVEARRHL